MMAVGAVVALTHVASAASSVEVSYQGSGMTDHLGDNPYTGLATLYVGSDSSQFQINDGAFSGSFSLEGEGWTSVYYTYTDASGYAYKSDAVTVSTSFVPTAAYQEWEQWYNSLLYMPPGPETETMIDMCLEMQPAEDQRYELAVTAPASGPVTFSSGSWTAPSSESVPEPTSGMLLLLGVAGLALKRRRA